MKKSELVQLVQEVLQELDEANVTGGTATFTAGSGEQYATPHAFGKKPSPRAKKAMTKLVWKKQERPKRPSHTKMFDYL